MICAVYKNFIHLQIQRYFCAVYDYGGKGDFIGFYWNPKRKLGVDRHFSEIIGHFTVVCLVTWPWIGSEAGGDLVLIQTSLFFICKCKLVSIRTA